MRARPKNVWFLALALVVAAVSPLDAQSAAALEGSYVYAPEAGDDIDGVVNDAVRKVKNPLLRPFAKGRLRKTNEPYRTIVIAPAEAGKVSIKTDDRAALVMPATGAPVAWTREDGEKMKVITSWEGNRLKQAFQAEDGSRMNVFSLSPDGRTLTMNVTITSEKLSAPVNYKLVYRRAS